MVDLQPGDLVRWPMRGLSLSTYENVLQTRYADSVEIAESAALIRKLRQRSTTDSTAAAAVLVKLKQAQDRQVAYAGDFTKLDDILNKAIVQPPVPLLLDPRFYKGVGAGALLATAVKLIFFPSKP